MRDIVTRTGPHLGKSVQRSVFLNINDDDSDVRIANQEVEALVKLRLILKEQGSVNGIAIPKVVVCGLKETQLQLFLQSQLFRAPTCTNWWFAPSIRT